MTRVIAALAALLSGTIIVLGLSSQSLSQPITGWTETTSYPLEVANRDGIVHDYRSNVYHSDVPLGATPTPTPPFVLQLKQNPNTWIAPGEQVTYEITYAGNQVDALQNLTITGLIPDNVELVPDSITTSNGGLINIGGTEPGSEIVWTWIDLPSDAIDSVSYAVVRPIRPTPSVPLSLSISKAGPETATANQEITYTLTVTNNAPVAITSVLIRDRVPTGATYLRGGSEVDGIVRWPIAELAPFSTTSVNFVVTAQSTIINSDYDVTADNGVQIKGQHTVVTTVDNAPPPVHGDGMVIVNPGAIGRWTSAQGQLSLPSNEVRNPEFRAHLPLLQMLRQDPPVFPAFGNGTFDIATDPVWVSNPSDEVLIYSEHDVAEQANAPGFSARSSPNVAWLGGRENDQPSLRQNVALPAEYPDVRLGFWHLVGSNERTCGDDRGYVVVDEMTLATIDLCRDTNTDGWQRVEVSLADFVGTTIDVTFRSTQDGAEISNWFLDDVILCDGTSAHACE